MLKVWRGECRCSLRVRVDERLLERSDTLDIGTDNDLQRVPVNALRQAFGRSAQQLVQACNRDDEARGGRQTLSEQCLLAPFPFM